MLDKFSFHFLKILRMLKYFVKYTTHPWKIINGIRLPVSLKYGYSVLRFIDDGSYENEEAAIVLAKLELSDKVLELGTGIGFISALCAKKVGDQSVYTYEANPDMIPVIRKLYRINNVAPQFRNALLSSNEDQTHFFTNKNFLASTQKKSDTKRNQVQVPVLPLNTTIAALNPTYLIMDIEGNEYDIFRIIDFQSINKVQFELHPSALSSDQINFIFERLKMENFNRDKSLGYRNNFFFKRDIKS